MKTSTRVVVIGGGVVGCSVLYHLTKLGWRDVMLIERSELTSGSTWHAAGGFHTLNGDTNMAALQGYTIKLYRELEALTGMSCGLHHVGGITLACDQDRFDMLVAERAKHRYMGLETEIISPEEIARRSPITNIDGVLGGLYDPLDGHLDPSGTTHAYAKAAKMNGAEIVLRNPVLATTQRKDGTWDVVTEKGTIHAEHIVNAAGLWAREVGALAGVYLPLHPMEHQYLVTEDIPAVYERDEELPHIMDPAGESYLRQEGRGLCIGFYEQNPDAWAVRGTPSDFGHELLENKLDRIENAIEYAYRRFPVLAEAGVKTIVNGPFTFAPDGNPLMGPHPDVKNYWVACAVMAGFSQGGGVGLSLAEWMIEGETSRDVFAMDVARFGNWTNPAYTRDKVRENYTRRFSIHYPNEELPAARPLKTTPVYPVWQNLNAVFGAQYGLEVMNYISTGAEDRMETPSFRRSNAFDAVAGEVKAVRENVGLNELQNFGKYLVEGENASVWLDRIMAAKLPKIGRIVLSPMLSPKGKVIGDFTITRLQENKFLLTASYGAQAFHLRWFRQNGDENVHITNISDTRSGFQIAGPRARDVLMDVVFDKTAAQDLKFMRFMESSIGIVPVFIQRLSYTGDLGYEIYCDTCHTLTLYEALTAAGANYGMKPFGMRAMMSLRLDPLFGSWMREFGPDYTLFETGLDRFAALEKPASFIGKAAALEEARTGAQRELAYFEVDAHDADVTAYEPIFDGDAVIGFCTSGGYSHSLQKSIAYGYVPRGFAKDNVTIEILGDKRPARRITATGFDTSRARA